jgi:hypothetical protein
VSKKEEVELVLGPFELLLEMKIQVKINLFQSFCKFLRILVHRENGSPVYPSGHEQIGLWLTVLQLDSIPHVLGQGSEHLSFKQAVCVGHSELTTHSGRHPGGLPI